MTDAAAPDDKGAPSAVRLRGYQGAASVHTAGLEALVAELARTCHGRFDIDLVPDGTADGTAAAELFAAIEAGGIEIGYMATGYLSARVPELRLLDLPFLFADPAAAFRLLDGPGGARIAAAVTRETGLVPLGFWDNGQRHITSRKGPVRRPGDGAGQTIRAIETPIYFATMEALGFDPVAVDVRDLAAAVSAGRIDAQENPLTNCHLFGVVAHQPWLSLTAHIQGIVMPVANSDWFASLSEEERSALDRAAVTATAHQRGRARSEEARLRDVLVADGAKVTVADEIDRAAMAAACAGFVERVLADLDPDLRAEVEGL